MTLSRAVRDALNAQAGLDTDKAVRALALAYAEALDDGTMDLDKGGPRLLQALDALLLTPKARRAAAPEKDNSNEQSGPNKLEQLRAKRGARGNRGPSIHTTPKRANA